jgi:hypothetical protein
MLAYETMTSVTQRKGDIQRHAGSTKTAPHIHSGIGVSLVPGKLGVRVRVDHPSNFLWRKDKTIEIRTVGGVV